MGFHFLGYAEFSKTNAQGRKRYKRKLTPKATGLLAHKEDRERVRTGVQVASESRQWINTASRLAKVLR